MMAGKTVGAAQFKAECLKLIDEMSRDRQPVIITKRGKPVAVLNPIAAEEKLHRDSLFGAMKGTVLSFDDPFGPAYDKPWDSEQEGPWEPER